MPGALQYTRVTCALAALLLFGCHCDGSGLNRVQRTAIADTAVNLGRPFVGDMAQATLTIHSTGRGAVNVVGISSSNAALMLDWSGAPAGRVPPSGTLDISVRWKPEQPEQVTGTIAIDLETDDPTQRHQEAQVTGESRAIPDCDDHNSCTDDLFDRASEQCRHTNTVDTCDDGNACTENDQCLDGQCRGVAKSCDDQNVCTLNLCDPAAGCVFPPDGRICDDADPCTKDVCNPSGGCQHPNADDGTACGAFSCAAAHVCVFGACRELDIRASSEGYPCSDGDVCTVNDTCHAGECQSGTRRESGPEVIATMDLYGGKNAWVATDGFRYVYVDSALKGEDPDGLRVATWDGQTLTPRGSLQIRASGPPVMVAPGRFAVPNNRELTLIDATDPDHPFGLWGLVLPPDVADGMIVSVFRMPGGLLVLDWDNTNSGLGGYKVVFIGLSDSRMTPERFVTIAQSPVISDLDAQDDVLAYALADSIVWMRLDANGQILSSATLPYPEALRVSVDHSSIAARFIDEIIVFNANGPGRRPVPCEEDSFTCEDLESGCDGTFVYPSGRYTQCATDGTCPAGSHCEYVRAGNALADVNCSRSCCDSVVNVCLTPEGTGWYSTRSSYFGSEVNDILLTNGMLYTAAISGVRSISTLAVGDEQPQPVFQTLDLMPATGLEREKNHILISGTAALAIRLDATPSTRVSGPGWGDVTAIVDQAEASKVLLSGPVVIGELDVLAAKFTRWKTTPLATLDILARFLSGPHRTAVVDPKPTVASAPLGGGEPSDQLNPWWIEEVQSFDDMQIHVMETPHASWVTSTPDRIWAVGMDTPNPIGNVVSSWRLSADRAQPDLAFDDPAQRTTNALRGEDIGNHLGALQFDYDHGTSRLLCLDVASQDYSGEYALESDASTHPGDGWGYSVDGSVALTAVRGEVRLHPRLPLSDEPPVPAVALPSLPLTDANWSPSPRVAAMSDGRAWVGWTQMREFSQQTVLSELHYDPQAMTLDSAGTVDVPGNVRFVYDSGQNAVAATDSAVVIVAPGCPATP